MSLHIKAGVSTPRAFQYHWMVWKIFGLQPPQHESKWLKPYFAFAIILNFSILLFPASLIIYLMLSKDKSELCENICNTISVLACNIKFLTTLATKHRILKVQETLERLDARAKTRKEVAILEEGITSARTLFIYFAAFCCVFLISIAAVVFFSGEMTEICPTWIPWNWTTSKRNYWLTNLYLFYAITMQILQNVVNDTYPAICLIMLSTQIKALASRIKDLGIKGSYSEELLYKELTNCIQDHNIVYKLYNIIQESISTNCLIQFAATALGQCTIGVYLLYIGIQPAKMLRSFFFFIAITTEIFMLCYYGELYCQANDHLTESIYDCNWMDRNQKFKKAFLFLLQRSQIPSDIMAGKVLIPVRLPVFVQVLKTAYSVFTVLNNVNLN